MGEIHGEGELFASDGVYRGQFVRGKREGHGRFEYKFPRKSSTLPSPCSASDPSTVPRQLIYEGTWTADQPHGEGSYSDEYGYDIPDARVEEGQLLNERRPPVKGLKEKYLNNPRWPTIFEPLTV